LNILAVSGLKPMLATTGDEQQRPEMISEIRE
jgi:hypothetical protein